MKLCRTSVVMLALVSLFLSACVAMPAMPAPTLAPATSAAPATALATTAAPVAAAAIPNLANGQAAWQGAQCSACHGPLALGGIGPGLAATRLSYDAFAHTIRTAAPPMPVYDAATLPDRSVYDIYAWVRVQLPLAQVTAAPLDVPTGQPARPEEVMGMTIWTCKKCNTCHGVFAQGSALGPVLAGLNDPLYQELAQMRSTAGTIKEHGADNIPDAVFERLYQWLKLGCMNNECSQ
jgi:mono/diheme cytochrome c family protein